MRVTSSLWVSALMRRAQANGSFATIVHKGSPEAGAIYVVVSDFEGQSTLFGPAPQLLYDNDGDNERRFEELLSNDESEIKSRLERERSFDPDIWIVEIEDRERRSFIDTIVRVD